MITVNSVSGGKTSGYIAAEYPADVNIFACVMIGDLHYFPKDRAITRYAQDKLGCYFEGTAESDKTLKAVMDLEQLIGQEIKWVTNYAFELLIEAKKMLPNARNRFCTTELKIKPIFNHVWYRETEGKKCIMNIGFRFDELERTVKCYFKIPPKKGREANPNFNWDSFIKKNDIPDYLIPIWKRMKVFDKVSAGALVPKPMPINFFKNPVEGNSHKFKTDNWRVSEFPLVRDRVFHADIIDYWRDGSIDWPENSNCEFCFHKSVRQINKFAKQSKKFQFWIDQEKKIGRTFRKDFSMEQIGNMAFTEEINFDGHGVCNEGDGCTD